MDSYSSQQSQLAAHGYSEPTSEIVALVDAPRPPLSVVSPTGQGVLLVEIETHPPLSCISEPVLRLAGIRLSPHRRSRQHLQYGKRLQWVSCFTGECITLALPEMPRIGIPVFSPDGSKFVFINDTQQCTELWLGDPETGHLRRIQGIRVNDVLVEQPLVNAVLGKSLDATSPMKFLSEIPIYASSE